MFKSNLKIVFFYVVYFVIVTLVVDKVGLFEFLINKLSYLDKFYLFLIFFIIQYFLFFLWLFLIIILFKFNIYDYIKSQFIFKWYKYFLYAFVLYFVMLLLLVLLKIFVDLLWINIPWLFWEQKTISLIKNITNQDIKLVIMFFLFVVFIWPFIEEIIYRWFINKFLLDNLGYFKGIILSSLIFAFVHFEWNVFFNLFIVSLFINYLHYKSWSLYYTLFFHFLINFLTFISILILNL